mmetsp:Transcript_8329/g.12114  ORF Transcript_8329/g.12114 Transcript_8329/m.12114 type:complete len:372 (+) Transcript_8329:91-1206(+)
MGRGKAWFQEADLHLSQAWVQSSDDPIVGNYQDGKSFWQTIQAAYRKFSPTNEERSLASIQARWSDINKKSTKFNGIYTQIKRVPRSGYNDEKYIQDALALYNDEEKESFPFLACWHYLKEKPKWLLNGAPKKKEANEAAVKKTDSLPSLPAISKEVAVNIDGDVGEAESSRPSGQKKAKEIKNVALRQVEVDEKTARALESRAETQKLQVQFKLMNSLGDCPAAKEWKELIADEILMEKKKKMVAKKREAEAEENREKRKKQISERLQKEVTPTELFFDEDKENLPFSSRSSSTASSLSVSSSLVEKQQQGVNLCCAGDYCYVSNGHKVVCGMTCRRCRQSCHFDCCEDDEYGFKICASCEKERACDEEV